MWSPGTGAPTSAIEPVFAHASTTGASRGSVGAIAGASSSYPVSDSSGKTTTRALARRTTSAWIAAFAATSYDAHGGWATASVSGSRIRHGRTRDGEDAAEREVHASPLD